jgi:hypothetical protein
MAQSVARHWLLFGILAGLLAACGSDSGEFRQAGEPDGGSVAAYTFTCAANSCDSCRDAAEDRYSECLRLCSMPFAPADCFSQCPSIGDTSCSHSCGENERCEEWKADLPLPERDEVFYESCRTWGSTCAPDVEQKFVDAQCNYESRVKQPRFGDEYECATPQCDQAASCFTQPAAGTLGTETCERAASCGVPCRPAQPGFSSDEDYMNSIEGSLRPSLASLARRCAKEETCAKFEACKEAFDYLWQLAWHEYSGL